MRGGAPYFASAPAAWAAFDSLCGCIRMCRMNKEWKENLRTPFWGFAAVLMSIGAFILLLYFITIIVRLLFMGE